MTQSKTFQPTVIFDLDGTLIDTAPDLTRALNHVLETINRPLINLDQVRHMVGHGAMALIKAGTTATGDEITCPDTLQTLLNHFLDYYTTNICVDSQPFPNMMATLQDFHDAHIPMGICTNKPEHLSRQLIDSLNMSHYFNAILGADSIGVKKPHPRHLLETVKQTGGDIDRAVMIGDSKTDFDTARAADIPVILVDFGYSDIPVHSLGADIVISDFKELPASIDQILGR